MAGDVVRLPALDRLLFTVDQWRYPSGTGGTEGSCRFRLWTTLDSRLVAVVTEMPYNQGAALSASTRGVLERAVEFASKTVPGPEGRMWMMVIEHHPGHPDHPDPAERQPRLTALGLAEDWKTPVRSPLWPVPPDHPDFDAHQLWADVYLDEVTGQPPVPLLS